MDDEKNDGFERSMEDKKIMIIQRKYGWWKKNHGLEQSMEDKKMMAFQRKYGWWKKKDGFELKYGRFGQRKKKNFLIP